MKRLLFATTVALVAICLAACSDDSPADETITEWTGTEIKPGLFLYYALSVDVEGEYSLPLIKAEIHQEPNLGSYVPKIIRLPVPNRDVKVTIRLMVDYYYPDQTDYFRELSSVYQDNSDTCSVITINLEKVSDSSSLPRQIDLVSTSSVFPAPFISTTPDGKLYSLSSEFWKENYLRNARTATHLCIDLIRIPEEHVPANTIRKYECTYFTPEEYGSSADEPDSAN